MTDTIHLGLILYPGCIPSGLFATAELLQAANQLAGRALFNMHWVGTQRSVDRGLDSGRHLAENPLDLRPKEILEPSKLDEVLIPGMWIQSMEDLQNILSTNDDLVQALRQLPPTTKINAYCSSVSFLALSGRLQQQKATSTWWLANFYTETFPDTAWDFNCAFMEGDHFTCASGVNGYLPIAMHLIERHLGEKILREVSKVMLLPRPEALQPAFQKVDKLSLTDPLMRKVLLWVEATPADALTTGALASAMNIAERTLARRIRAACDESTMGFMRLIKLNQASEALILSSDSISKICEQIGYEDDRTFRRAFKRATRYTPAEYREAFSRRDMSPKETPAIR